MPDISTNESVAGLFDKESPNEFWSATTWRLLSATLDHVTEELADIAICLFRLYDVVNIDTEVAIGDFMLVKEEQDGALKENYEERYELD